MRRKTLRGLAIYALLVLAIASWRAWQVHSAPIDCADSERHGPDPGTECDAAIADQRARRPRDARDSFLASILFGGLGVGAWGTFRLLGRRFADHGGSAP